MQEEVLKIAEGEREPVQEKALKMAGGGGELNEEDAESGGSRESGSGFFSRANRRFYII